MKPKPAPKKQPLEDAVTLSDRLEGYGHLKDAALVRNLLSMLEDIAPPLPINQDEGGCVWCGGTPPGQPNGFAMADVKHHQADCPWLVARLFLGLVPSEKGQEPTEE